MAERGEDLRTIAGREVRIVWRRATFGEWLAWCYIPGPDLLHNQGVGFEARAASAPEAVKQLVARVRTHFLAED